MSAGSGDSLETGIYELSFHAADYFHRPVLLTDPPFMGVIIIRIVASSAGNYHVSSRLPYGWKHTAAHDVPAGSRGHSPVRTLARTPRNLARPPARLRS
jgi:hypothetical protein